MTLKIQCVTARWKYSDFYFVWIKPTNDSTIYRFIDLSAAFDFVVLPIDGPVLWRIPSVIDISSLSVEAVLMDILFRLVDCAWSLYFKPRLLVCCFLVSFGCIFLGLNSWFNVFGIYSIYYCIYRLNFTIYKLKVYGKDISSSELFWYVL